MLPEKLSTDLTSLGESQERLSIVIEMAIAPDGTVTASDIYRAVVLNRTKLAYNGMAAWLEGTAPARLAAVPGLDEQLRVQDRAAQAMKRVRHAHGALRLETLEVRPVFAKFPASHPKGTSGWPSGTTPIPRRRIAGFPTSSRNGC